jgi:hypothetical protein
MYRNAPPTLMHNLADTEGPTWPHSGALRSSAAVPAWTPLPRIGMSPSAASAGDWLRSLRCRVAKAVAPSSARFRTALSTADCGAPLEYPEGKQGCARAPHSSLVPLPSSGLLEPMGHPSWMPLAILVQTHGRIARCHHAILPDSRSRAFWLSVLISVPANPSLSASTYPPPSCRILFPRRTSR